MGCCLNQESEFEVDFLTQKRVQNIKNSVKSWKSTPNQYLKFIQLSGNTNIIGIVENTFKDANPKRVIYREFGNGADDFIDREQEIKVFKRLGKLNLAPKTLGGDDTFRVEEFYNGRTCNVKDMSDPVISRKIFARLAELHQLEIKDIPQESQIKRICDKKMNIIEKVLKKMEEGKFTEQERKWLEAIKQFTTEEEINFIRSIMPKDVVFSHNDLIANNIMIISDSKDCNDVQFIDFEYGSMNYRAFDFGNHFAEFILDYNEPKAPWFKVNHANFPSDKKIKDCIKIYLIFVHHSGKIKDKASLFNKEGEVDKFIKENDLAEEFSQRIPSFIKDIRACVLYSSFLWALWGVLMSGADIDLGFIEFGYARIQHYLKMKEIWFGDKL